MRMPTMSGAAFLRRARALYPETMRVLLTGYSDIASIVEAVNEGGVYRYLNKPWDDQDLLMTLEQALEQRRLRAEAARLAALTEAQNETLRRFNAELETQVRARTEELAQTVLFLEAAQQDLKSSFTAMVQVCASMIELRCGSASGHAMRVGEIARRLALSAGMSSLHAQDVLRGVAARDRQAVAARRAAQADRQDDDRRTQPVQQHPLRAQMVLTPIAQLHKVASIVLHQYERFNGRGRPTASSATRFRKARGSSRSRATSKGCATAKSARRIRSSRRSTCCARRPACATTRCSSRASST
jgi:response regulator RpfG family c-di-GMP phosphodiesterase